MSSHNSASPHNVTVAGVPGKRSADDAASDNSLQQAAKRKRPQSCDTCRSRKIKCVRLQVDGLDASADNRCVQCRAIDAKCTFDYIPKRPGPQSSFAKTARRNIDAQAKPTVPYTHQAATPSSHSRTSTSAFVDAHPTHLGGPSPHAQQSTSGHSPNDDSWYRALTAQSIATGSGSNAGTQTRSSSWGGGNFDAYLNNSMLAMTPSQFAGMSAASPFDFSPHNMGGLSGPSPSMSMSGASSATPGSYAGSSWHGPPRSDAGSSRSAAPLASMSHSQPQVHHQQQHPAASLVDHLQSFEMAAGSAVPDGRATPLPLPIPSFSRVQSPVPISASLPQTNEPSAHQSHHHHQQQRQPNLHFGTPSSDLDVLTRAGNADAASGRKSKDGPSLSNMSCGPVIRPRSLDDVAPRQTFLAIVSLYFHYLWPLLPIVDRPSFSHDLLNRRDERDHAFFAFVLSLTSYTLIQCPRTVIPAPWSVYRRLHRICHLTSRRMQPRVYDPPQLLHVATLYCDHIYLGTVGKINAGKAVLAEAVRVAYTLGLHDERKNDSRRGAAPYGLDASSFAHYQTPAANAVENELRKRMFWILHGSSTTIAMLEDEPALIHAIDACVDLPLAVDEEALARPGHIQRTPSLLHGFLTVTRLHQVMLELLESYRRDRRFPIDDLSVARSRIRYLADVLRRLQRAIDEMPEELRNPVYSHSPPEPIRRPGSALPALETVSARGQPQQQQHDAPLLQAIGFDAATQTALGNHLSGTSPWPWPAETFTRDGLPNADARSSNNSSATHSPGVGGASTGNAAGVEGGQPPHHVLTPPPALTPRNTDTSDPAGSLTMVDLVNVFRPSPPPSATPVLSPMCTMHANIVTTESLVRFLVTEYREMVTTRIRDLKLRQPSHLSATASAPEDVQGEAWQEAAANLLRTFNDLPLDALASNGQSLIDKIIYVVSALLNRTGNRGGLTSGFGYMSSLLATLTRLSQTRKDDSVGEFEEDEAAAERWERQQTEEGGGRGGSAGAGAGGGRSDGGSNRGGGGSSSGGPGSNGGGNNGRGGGDGREQSGDRVGRGNSNRLADTQPNPFAKPHFHHQHQLQQMPSPSSPFLYPTSSSAPSTTGTATESNESSTVNTASTTPTSEHPPVGTGFYDKLMAVRSVTGAAPRDASTAQLGWNTEHSRTQTREKDGLLHHQDTQPSSPLSAPHPPAAATHPAQPNAQHA
ncbi:hypothetical protein PHSY_001206 [Pseudozyma hubeiensis SY62]|uniref:Zn(2)-C6 fungal-type domain-containing protein n=1 Tax=Pseudozyma hubeiensis (strain SY62) TaxID=1305764 RepID=R9NYA9_PSEHS|nr:hypothetical protein PHSY_001206 [Pseudozyma hubeiensis SY62]GAC93641.1 hypothetical protein PHSY_001206 [Pseudozyma hubeiensis SY62]